MKEGKIRKVKWQLAEKQVINQSRGKPPSPLPKDNFIFSHDPKHKV